jgi:hypothetical protein
MLRIVHVFSDGRVAMFDFYTKRLVELVGSRDEIADQIFEQTPPRREDRERRKRIYEDIKDLSGEL